LKSLFGQSALQTESVTGLRKLLDTTIENTRALKVLGQPVDQWNFILMYIVVDKLDPDPSRCNWELSTSSSSPPNFEELKTFLDQRCRALEATGIVKHKSSHPQRGPPNPLA